MERTSLEALAQAGSSEHYIPVRGSAPNGWEPGVRYEPGGSMTVTTPPVAPVDDEDGWHALITDLGAKVPAGWRVRLVEARFDPYAWTRDRDGEDATTKPAWRYKFAVEPLKAAALDADELIEQIRKWKPPKQVDKPAGGVSFIVAYADTQLGKPDGDGTTGTVERIQGKTHEAVQRFRELKKQGRPVESVTIALLGDHIEGFNSQGGRLAWRNELTLTEMVRVWRRLLLDIVRVFAQVAPQVTVVVIPGNHDEAVRTGDAMSTRYDDSWAIDAASAVADALALSEGYDHVAFVFPKRDELTVTLDVSGTVVGFAHGHQTRGKTHDWWGKQAHGMQAIGAATLLLTGHYHHLKVDQAGAKTWVQAPALDGGSQWFLNSTGLDAPAGLVTMLVGNGGWTDLAVL